MPCLGELIGLGLLTIIGAFPFAVAGELVKRHCPENLQTAVSCGLVALGWGGGLVLLLALYFTCVLVAAVWR